MSTKRNSRQVALFSTAGGTPEKPRRDAAITRRMELVDNSAKSTQYQPAVNNSLKIKLDHLRTFQPLTENQSNFFDLYKSGSYFMGLFGSAGTGKTFCALYKAIEEVLDKTNSFKRVVIVRSAVQVRDQGAVPGTIEEKMAIYEQPYKEICAALFDRPDAWDRLKEQGVASFISTTTIRGISLDDAVIIVDEATNCNWAEISAVVTRVGNRSKIIFCGDVRQNDLTKSRYDVTGVADFLKVANSMGCYSQIDFTTDDIVRSRLVKEWIIASESFGY